MASPGTRSRHSRPSSPGSQWDVEKCGTPDPHVEVTLMPSCPPTRRNPTRTNDGPRERTWYRQPVLGYVETSRPLAARHSETTWPAAPLQERRCAVGPVGAVLVWVAGGDDEGGGSA